MRQAGASCCVRGSSTLGRWRALFNSKLTMTFLNPRAACVIVCFACACSVPVDKAVDSGDPTGCYVIATGNTSRWRPRAWLPEPKRVAAAHFFLAPANDSLRYPSEWGVSLSADTTQVPWFTSNWRRRSNGEIVLDNHQVDWGYKMTLTPVTADSVRGFVRFSGDGLNGTARVAGHRTPCPSDLPRTP